MFDEKTRGKKSRETVSLKAFKYRLGQFLLNYPGDGSKRDILYACQLHIE
jgi:hypothetical protein